MEQSALFEELPSEPTTIQKIKRRDRFAVRKLANEWGFEDFWAIWPERKGKAAAEAAFLFNLNSEDRKNLVGRTTWYIRRRRFARSRGAWIPLLPHASTYLNQRRWEDEFTTDALIYAVPEAASNEEANQLMASLVKKYGAGAFNDPR
jgi:hypothetical protein